MQEVVDYSKLHYADSQYPMLLKQIRTAPKELFVRGKLVEMPMVSIVGTRRPSQYGVQVTERLTRELVQAGIGIVSGLALGIDAIAHQAALDAGGYTIAVLGCGIDMIYPQSNQRLALQILEKGGSIVSEHPPGMPALKQNFPARNRIIAGLSKAVIVTEADGKSGTLHTANAALDNNREVMAVPGNIFHETSVGPHNLIRQGAQLVTDSSNILASLNIEKRSDQSGIEFKGSESEMAVINVLKTGVTDSQQIINESGLDAVVFAQTISLLEITGQVKNLGPGQWGLSHA